MIYHNSQDLNYRKPFGACPVGTGVNISIYADLADGVKLYVKDDNDSECVYDIHSAERISSAPKSERTTTCCGV